MENWIDKVNEVDEQDKQQYCNIVLSKPAVVSWFSVKKKKIHRLIKITARVGDNLWVIPEFVLGAGKLKTVVRYPTVENGWELREFFSEKDFYLSAAKYYEE